MNIPADYMNVVYEKIRIMKTYAGWGFEEVYMLPVRLREWFYDKWIQDNKNPE